MSDCKHKWIGDTCCECGVAYGVWVGAELDRLRADNARLVGEVEALRAAIKVLFDSARTNDDTAVGNYIVDSELLLNLRQLSIK